MNWYKKAQKFTKAGLEMSQSLILDQGQYLDQSGYFGSALPKTERKIDELGLNELLSEFAGEDNFVNTVDYIVCSVFPALERECRNFYKKHGLGEGLIELHSKTFIRNLDEVCVAKVIQLNRKYQEMLKSNEQQQAAQQEAQNALV